MPFRRFSLLLLTLAAIRSACAAEGSVDPLTAVFTPLQSEAAAISPDGNRVAYSKRENDGVNVYIFNLDTGVTTCTRIAEDVQHPRHLEKTLARVVLLHWAGADYLVIQQRDYPTSEFFVVNGDGSRPRSVFDWNDPEWKRIGVRSIAPKSLDLVVPQPNQPGFVSIFVRGIPHSGSGNYFTGIYRFNLATLEWTRTAAEEFPGRFLLDGMGSVRGKHTDRGNPQEYYYLPPGAPFGAWKPIRSIVPAAQAAEFAATPEDFFSPRSLPISFGHEPHHLYYVSSRGRDTLAFRAMDLKTGKLLPEKVEDELFDVLNPERPAVNPVVRDPHTAELLGVRYTRLKHTTRWFDAGLAALQAQLEEKWPAHSVELLGWDRARERLLGLRYSRSDPGEYFILDIKQSRVTTLAVRSPALTAQQGGIETRPVVIEVPNRLPLTAYLTLPGRQESKPSPVVVRFSSELWSRALAGFQVETRALAEMGVAVLEVNHRGLPGRGLEQWQAGRGRADEVAAEDVIVVLDELAKRGVIDARRVAVIGSTFGGYLALRALQLHPGRFVCGVVADVPSDLPAWLNIDQRWRDAATKFRMQTEAWFFGTDQAQLRRHSPLYHPRPIGRPLLVMEDAVRQNIMPRNFDKMVRKLEADGEPIERTPAGELLGRGAGTGNYIAHGAIRVFLARHLGVKER